MGIITIHRTTTHAPVPFWCSSCGFLRALLQQILPSPSTSRVWYHWSMQQRWRVIFCYSCNLAPESPEVFICLGRNKENGEAVTPELCVSPKYFQSQFPDWGHSCWVLDIDTSVTSSEQESWCDRGPAESNLDSSASVVIPNSPTGRWQGLQIAIIISCLGATSGFGNSLAFPDSEIRKLMLVEHKGMLMDSLHCQMCLPWPVGMLVSQAEISVMWADVVGEVFINLITMLVIKNLHLMHFFNCWYAFLFFLLPPLPW